MYFNSILAINIWMNFGIWQIVNLWRPHAWFESQCLCFLVSSAICVTARRLFVANIGIGLIVLAAATNSIKSPSNWEASSICVAVSVYSFISNFGLITQTKSNYELSRVKFSVSGWGGSSPDRIRIWFLVLEPVAIDWGKEYVIFKFIAFLITIEPKTEIRYSSYDQPHISIWSREFFK